MHRLQALRSISGDSLWRLDLTPDAGRVVAGRAIKHCVHVWTRRRLSSAASAASGGHAYTAIALLGRKDCSLAVQVSRTGERIVSSSKDGSVLLWRVAMDAVTAALGADGAPKVVAFRTGRESNGVTALALAAVACTVYAGICDQSEIVSVPGALSGLLARGASVKRRRGVIASKRPGK